MKIIERFNIRKQRAKGYWKYASICRSTRKSVSENMSNITAVVDADKVDSKTACIKVYHTYAPATNMNDIGENVYHHIEYCPFFSEHPCTNFNCPYCTRNRQYNTKKMLLDKAQSDKKLAFKKIFERIK